MKILINALSGIGDALMFSPALKVLKSKLPSSQIEMLVMFRAVGDMYSRNPAIDKIHFIDFLNQSALSSFKQVYALRKNKYDATINVYPSNRREYNLINFMLGAKLKIATKYNHYSSRNFHFLNYHLAQEVQDRHNVLQNLELVKFLAPDIDDNEAGKYEVFLNGADRQFAEKYVTDNNLAGKMLIGFHAGSATFKRHINKRWAAEKFALLAKQLRDKYGAVILLFGTEEDVNGKIFALSEGAAIKLPKMGIMESAALMAKCTLFVSNDAALMHIASALEVPVAAIFGYTNYNELHPWKTKYEIVRKELDCSPCFFNSPRPVKCIYSGEDEFKCMKTISVDEVMAACEKLIKEIPGNIKA